MKTLGEPIATRNPHEAPKNHSLRNSWPGRLNPTAMNRMLARPYKRRHDYRPKVVAGNEGVLFNSKAFSRSFNVTRLPAS